MSRQGVQAWQGSRAHMGVDMTDQEPTGPSGPLAHVLALRGGIREGHPIQLEHREALIYTLGKAAELEHLIMLQYLHAAFSLKQGEAEGLSAAGSRRDAAVAQDAASGSPSRRCSTSRSSRTC